MATAKWMAHNEARPAREQAEDEGHPDGELQVDRDRRQDLAGSGTRVCARNSANSCMRAPLGDVVPDIPDEEQPDEHPHQQQREVGEALRGAQEQNLRMSALG